jgi:hypothetical protein
MSLGAQDFNVSELAGSAIVTTPLGRMKKSSSPSKRHRRPPPEGKFRTFALAMIAVTILL